MAQNVSRNGACPCGSGKKFKACCLRSQNRFPLAPSSRLNGSDLISFAPRQPAPRPVVSPPVDQREWCEVHAVIDLPSGEAYAVVAVYSRNWLRTKNAKVGSLIPLNIPKVRIRGEGRVESIRPSEMNPQGEGLVLSIDHWGKPDPQGLPPAEHRNWQQVHVRLEEAGGTSVSAVLLHSREWLNLQGIRDGGEFPLNLTLQRVEGKGRIVLIEPSPMISDGEGRVMTFVRSNRKADETPDPLSRPGVRTYFGERLPPIGHEWVHLVLSRADKLTSDLRLTRSTEWMRANWSAVEELRKDETVPTEPGEWRFVHVAVDVQDQQKVHIAFFYQLRWVEAQAMTVGEPVLLRLPNDHLSGEGRITAIDPAPFVPGPDEPPGRMFVAGKRGGQGKGTIETTDVGDYVTTYTHEERGDRLPVDDTQGKWAVRQRIRLHLDKEDSGHSKIVFLRDAKWVRTERVVVGGTVSLNMPEMSCVGAARVEAVEPCMVFLRWGNSSIRMVTGTFAHSAGVCGELKLRGESKPIGVTPRHPFWSEDRFDWIPAGELQPGETVKTIAGTTTVESYAIRDTPEPVYNIEVEGDHCYRVGEQGVLVHNSSVCKPCEHMTRPQGTTVSGAGGTYTVEYRLGTDEDGKIMTYESAGLKSRGAGADKQLVCRVSSLRGTVKTKKDTVRDPAEIPQDLWRRLMKGLSVTGQEAGHMLGLQFGGPDDVRAIIPMDATLNVGDWASMENRMTACLARDDVDTLQYDLSVSYDAGGVVPSRFDVVVRFAGPCKTGVRNLLGFTNTPLKGHSLKDKDCFGHWQRG